MEFQIGWLILFHLFSVINDLKWFYIVCRSSSRVQFWFYSSFKILELQKQAPRGVLKKVFLEISQDLQENTCKKEALAQAFSCELCEISKNTFSYRTPPMVASGTAFFVRIGLRLLQQCTMLLCWTRNHGKYLTSHLVIPF